MDGLECSEVLFSTVRKSSNALRIDSHYFEKQYLMLKEELLFLPHWFLKDIVSKPIQTGHTPSMANSKFYDGEIALIKTDNLHENNIGQVFSNYLTKEGNAQISRTTLRENDVITTIIGATEEVIARSALVLSEYLPANINQNIVQIRVDQTIAYPEYINAYLNSKFGRQYLRYLSRQTEQVNLNCEEVGLTIVPEFSDIIQKAIKKCTALAHKSKIVAKQCYTKAELLLTDALNISSFATSKQSISIKTFSESYDFSGRLDAEYYQSKYDDYETALKTEDTVRSLCNLYDKNFVPKADVAYDYIELANVGNSGDINDVDSVLGKNLPSRARRRVKSGQVIIASVEGSLQSCALITNEYSGALCSTGFYVVDSDYINSETLLVLFKSEPIQALLKQRCSGTILTAITKDEFLSMPLPKIEQSVQKQIAEKVQESFALRHQSEQLLENAKRAVEIAIEQDEEKAMKWLKEKGVEC